VVLVPAHVLLGAALPYGGPTTSIYAVRQVGDVAAELVVSHVLLGAPQAAARLLQAAVQPPGGGGGGGSGRQQQQRPEATAGEVLAYVRGASPEGDADLLPGLVAFTETWLARVSAFKNAGRRRHMIMQ